ncbi:MULTISPECIES: threonine--tRNA ligase [Sulfitobacter]|jgi:threonyl-tRNA synthetase|uniref:Threonine--tRNA ligase n=3 Tax=Sulfitobacter TaxID=60136 RepID=A0A1H2WWD6_9RHOB|nr:MULTISPECIES: threonine--tRNA ligase [Sulfitobacter]HBM39789.1 threonine--tRNA ligase [Sulfitobacter sp.]AXI50682.1 threonine--tRNA ligase [Sulfitobacter sp. SK025]EAP80288.1 threonyl-tRNA synthetase [Sulfitobacter sp. NAS-14.1]KAJ31899.1 threonyl-tRNA synthetase [Sulfitobacter pontiacus 3SOLIMAR09]PTA98565.1 threonine--tRNA ligase [Sulfitobacter sp. CB-A]|tara:strand:+ start:547 stop:2496 length:1950 start_codon:yes stop_codon:yes gene_type:complete
MAQITLTLPDGNARQYDAGITAGDVANDISKSLGKKAISATVDGAHYDLAWPINADASIAIHTMADEAQANELVRHDLAHIMARAVQELWPDTKVTIGPVIKDGWYYDFDRKESFTPEDLGLIEKKMKEIINKRDPVRTEVWDRERAIKHYEDNGEPYKVELINSIPGDEPLRMYWHGDWQDLCRGPHLQHTGQVPGDAFKLMSIAGAYWRGDSDRAMLQRIYGVAFTGKEKLKAHLNMLEEAAKRDHRKLGREMDLYHMQEEAPGQVFWHANGWLIYTQLQDYMRRKQRAGGYVEVNTPQVVDRKLWEASGHWEKYQDHMFIVEVDEEHAREKSVNALKPMNCPCHVQIFNQGLKSYRDLPLRMAEFGSCNRYEPSGALHGIMRVRGFTQDDGHIFCAEDQIEAETAKFIEFLSGIYKDLGFENFSVKFSDRPEKRSGSDEVWDKAEAALLSATRKAGIEPTLNPGEGAFYGPKLEFVLTDAIGRDWQCGTHQVDFVLPERLDATYIGSDGAKHRPVMLHRATLGSFERFIGILIEEHAGKLPFWLAPRQVVVASITSEADDYVHEVVATLKAQGVRAEADIRNEKINYKVREHSVGKVPVILAVGAREVEEKTVSVRRLGEKQTSVQALSDVANALGIEATPPDLRG